MMTSIRGCALSFAVGEWRKIYWYYQITELIIIIAKEAETRHRGSSSIISSLSVDRKNISVCAGHRRLALMNGLIRGFKSLFVKMGQHVTFFRFSVVKKWNLCNHS